MPVNNITYNAITVDRYPEQFALAIKRSFPFFRRHAEGRYTDKTMMSLVRFHEQHASYPGDPTLSSIMPSIVVAEVPSSYDEITEVKYGGVIGMAVMFPNSARTMLAVHRDMRRNRIGATLFERLRYDFGSNPVLWVGRNNISAQHFCLQLGLVPTALNSTGSIRYSDGTDEDA